MEEAKLGHEREELVRNETGCMMLSLQGAHIRRMRGGL